jgi:acetyl esterase/lipase
MLPFYGVYDWTNRLGRRDYQGLLTLLERYVVKQPYEQAREVYDAASPLSHVDAGGPAALVVHGDLDTLAPVEEAREFVQRLRASSNNPVVFAELRGAHHAFDVFNSIRTLQTVAGVELFLAWLVSVEPPAGPPPPAVARTSIDLPDVEASDPTPTARTAPS